MAALSSTADAESEVSAGVLGDAEVTDLNLRALRIIETRLRGLLGEMAPAEAVKLLALEMSEVGDGLALVAAIAAVGATTIIMMAKGFGIEAAEVLTEIRAVVAPARGDSN